MIAGTVQSSDVFLIVDTTGIHRSSCERLFHLGLRQMYGDRSSEAGADITRNIVVAPF